MHCHRNSVIPTVTVIHGELTADTLKDAAIDTAVDKGAGKVFQLLEDMPSEVTEAGLSLGRDAVTSLTPSGSNDATPSKIDQPVQRDEDPEDK